VGSLTQIAAGRGFIGLSRDQSLELTKMIKVN